MIYIVIPVALCGVLIFGNLPKVRNTWIGSIRREIIRRLLHFNNASNEWITVNSWWLNWLIPLFYVVVVTFCLYEFFHRTWSILYDDIRRSLIHRIYIIFTISMVYGFTILATFSNPGKLSYDNANESNEYFINDEIIFFNDNYCSTCKLLKPARSKHCSTCNRCVILFDHHCIWINNCVGYYNYKYFIGFLLSNLNLLIYGGYICNKSIPSYKLGFDRHHEYYQEYKITLVFILLCGIFSMITGIFFAFHLRYIYLGVSTNELDKWGEIEYLVSLGNLYYYQGQYLEKVDNHLISLKDETTIYQFDQVNAVPIKTVEVIDNIYDQGFKNNLLQRLFVKNLD